MAIDQFKDINLDILKNLRGAKQQFGQAKTDEERQKASALGDSIRSKSGIKAGSQGLLSLPQLDELIKSRETVNPVDTVQPAPTDIRQQITDATKQRTIQALQNQFTNTQSGLQAERAKLDPMFRTATGQVRTQDTMDRARAEKLQATQGLTGSGAQAQTNIAQNVITGGQMSGLKEQKLNLESDINRRLQEAQRMRDQGIATAEIDSNIAQMQNELTMMEQQQAAELKQAEINSERDFELYKMELEQVSDKEKLLLENELERENTALEFEIDQLLNQQKFEQAKQLENIKTQNDAKLEAIKQSGRMQELGARQAFEREQAQGQPGAQGGLPLKTITSSLDNLVSNLQNPRVNQLMQQLDSLDPNTDFIAREGIIEQINLLQKQNPDASQVKSKVLNAMVENSDWFVPETLRETLALYNITPQELANFEAMRESALNSRPFE